MAIISSRQQLIDYCMRRLGEPVIEVNVDEDQVEDKIDDTLQIYREFHSDATFRTYYQHQMTIDDIENGYVDIPPRIIYVTKMFPASASFVGSTNMFSFQYQVAMSDFHTMSDVGGGGGLSHYDQMRSYMELIDMKINGLPIINFNRRQDRVYLWSDIKDGQIKEGTFVCFECYEIVPAPEDKNPMGRGDVSTIYNDMFVKDYTTALIKEQWGMNLSKFEGMQLPGGVTINGRQLVEDARGEIETLRERMRLEQEEPPIFLVG